MPRVTPFLWFDGKAREAANFYVSIFKNARIVSPMRNGVGRLGPGWSDHVHYVRDRRTGVHRLQRRPPLHVLRRRSRCSCAARPRPRSTSYGKEAIGGRRDATLRLAEGQIRRVLADHSADPRRNAAEQGCREVQARHAGDAEDGQDRHRGFEEGTSGRAHAQGYCTGSIRRHAGGLGIVEVGGTTPGERWRRWRCPPGLRGWVVDERGALRRHVRLFLRHEAISLDAPVGPDDELHIVAAISGG